MKIRKALPLALSFLMLAALGSPVCPVPAARSMARQESTPVSRLPVKEVTIFKDGHTLVIQEGDLPLNDNGELLLDNLPTPVLGTFFPYSGDQTKKLVSAVAGKRKITRKPTALSLSELIAGNKGARVHVEELVGSGDATKLIGYDAEIVGFPERSAEELAEANPAVNADLTLPERSDLVELKTESGFNFVPVERIQTLTFKGDYQKRTKQEDLKDILSLKFDGSGTNKVGMMYLQKGLRWIPSYKVTVDGSGHAKVKLQATLVNDLIDLEDVSANLVVGVPSFAFKEDTDPISLNQTLARVANNIGSQSRLGYLSNAIMTQQAYGAAESDAQAPSAEPIVTGGGKNEDLFVFNIKHLSLKKGERAVLPVAEYQAEYKDLYSVEIPVMPPPEVQNNRGGEQILAKLEEALKVMHKIRLKNSAKQPFTTAPALICLENGNKQEVLAQSLMTYTSPGASSDMDLTNAVDIKVSKNERETSRTPDAVTWQNDKFARINMEGELTFTNYSGKTINLEFNRKVLGKLDKISDAGRVEMLNPIDEWSKLDWHGYFTLPHWWLNINGIGKFTGTPEMKPGESLKVNYSWHYFWRS